MITMKPEELAENFDNASRITNPHELNNEYLQEENNLNINVYGSAASKYNKQPLEENYNEQSQEQYWEFEIIKEEFNDEGGILAVFLSSKNDIIDYENYDFDGENNAENYERAYTLNRCSNVNNVNYVQTEDNVFYQTMDRKAVKYFSK